MRHKNGTVKRKIASTRCVINRIFIHFRSWQTAFFKSSLIFPYTTHTKVIKCDKLTRSQSHPLNSDNSQNNSSNIPCEVMILDQKFIPVRAPGQSGEKIWTWEFNGVFKNTAKSKVFSDMITIDRCRLNFQFWIEWPWQKIFFEFKELSYGCPKYSTESDPGLKVWAPITQLPELKKYFLPTLFNSELKIESKMVNFDHVRKNFWFCGVFENSIGFPAVDFSPDWPGARTGMNFWSKIITWHGVSLELFWEWFEFNGWDRPY